MLKIRGLKEFSISLNNLCNADLTTNYLLKLAERLKKLSLSRMAKVSGEMTRETTAYMSKKNVSTVAVNVPYGTYNHEGQRADGSRVIKNRTAPGQKFFLKKSAQQLDLKSDISSITKDLKNKIL